ncbi:MULTISPECIES: ParA family protein [Shewanella]|uniref:ParA family protein n=1 Tax=Shewanella TaxID=22 RepID=UPI00217E8286|nr:ParA family protein [Shewanella xiamenensis]MCT8865466.1 ParA family protein [Shewanella xiamenensis]MCT8869030.1 ParA family protein [Shewanella xiamenensis]MCT8873715.1 ParA family protein [Shewanella xiamenensis]UWH40014.1 ParA family protein [Shewanella xiamenensis]
MEIKDFDFISSKADTYLEVMNKQVLDLKKEFCKPEFHMRYSKKTIESFPYLSRNAVEKAMTELEAQGYEFKRKDNGNLDSFSLMDVIAIYEQRKVPKYRNTHSKGFVLYFNNLKGGSGKTSACVNTAHALRTEPTLIHHDLRVIVFDLDPQASATMFYKSNLAIGGQPFTTAKAMFTKELTREDLLRDYIFETDVPGVYIMPAAIDDAFLTTSWLELCEEKLDNQEPHSLLKENVIEKLLGDFDILAVDSGPHLDFSLLNGIVAADLLVTPLPPAPVDFHSSLKYLSQLPLLLKYLSKQGIDVSGKELMGFMNKFSSHIMQHQESLSGATLCLGEKMLDAHIPELSGFQRCGVTLDTVISVDPTMYDGGRSALKSSQDAIYTFARSFFARTQLIRSRQQ